MAANDTTAIPHYVEESVVLAMNVAHEMLCALRQVQDGLKVYNFRSGTPNVGKCFRKEFEVT
jgi:hypothetical protein